MIIRDCALGQTRIVANPGPKGLRLGDVRIGNRIKGRFVKVDGGREILAPLQDETIDRSPEDPFDRALGDAIQASIRFRRQADRHVKLAAALSMAPRLVKPGHIRQAVATLADVMGPDKRIEPERAKRQPTGYDTRSKLSTNYGARPAQSGAFWAGGYGRKR